MTQPGICQRPGKPVGAGAAHAGEAKAQHQRHGPGAQRPPFDSALVPVSTAGADIQQVFGAVVLAMDKVDDKDGHPRGNRNGRQRDKGDEGAIKAVGVQHEVNRATEDRDDIHDNGLHPLDLHAQGQGGQAGGIDGQVIGQQQAAKGAEQVGDSHPGRQHVADRGNRVGG